jgi:hypothetical protein
MGLIEDLMAFLDQVQNDPIIYGPVFFLYAIASTIVLPIPVEFGLFLSPATPIAVKALILGAGKGVGSILVFYIGVNVEKPILSLCDRWKWFCSFVNGCQWFVEKFRYLGLYVILSIPLMVDTIPVYLFSIFNKDGKTLDMRYFALVNFAAGVTRAAFVYIFFEFLGIQLFS